MKIRKAIKSDFNSYVTLFEKHFTVYSSLDRAYYQTILDNRFLYFAEINNQIVGMIYCFRWQDKKLKTICEIQNLCVLEDFRNQGIATELVKYVLSELKTYCNHFRLIDGSFAGATELIAKKLHFNQDSRAKKTFIIKSTDVPPFVANTSLLNHLT